MHEIETESGQMADTSTKPETAFGCSIETSLALTAGSQA
jgi:hypothetical protein